MKLQTRFTVNNSSPNNQPSILHIAPTPFFSDRGCHIRIAGVVRSLQKLNFNNSVCTYHTGRDLADIPTIRISSIRNYTKTSAGPSPYKFLADLKLLIICLKEYRRTKPIAIHAHLHEGVLIGLILKTCFFWRRTPLIADMQGSLAGELESYGVFRKYPLLKFPIKAIERLLLLFSTHIVCSSQHSLDLFTELFPESAKKISLAQDGADEPADISSTATDKLRSSLGISQTSVCIVYSGALLDSKGLIELKQLILKSRDLAESVHFLIIGYPTENIELFLDENQLQHLCTLTGKLDFDVLADHLALGTIAIDPKNSDAGEGSGKLLNYMANSMAVVAFDTTNNRVFLGDTARLASTVDEAHEIMLNYVKDCEASSAAGKASNDRYKSKYSWEVCQKQLQSVYEKHIAISS